ncbi:MAG: bifunctional adenosylcobinamide kinase/adenosylcobinamide-phosphate guanylyltransferase, partial [Candidatus Obscuribacterales bacterium]|nr:bifunctional adenosylcobinamide kinase/adenosylcobinamide-phosphate guanylyltransferase [Candidatus Obscuribacterales bacterium]
MSNTSEADLKESLENLLLITGGTKSGKSSLAEEIARQSGKQVFFVATMPEVKDDPELEDRIARHRKGRPAGWTTIEEPIHIENAIESIKNASALVLIDCLSLFVSNLMLAEKISTPESLEQRLELLIDSIAKKPQGSFII